MLAAQRAAVHMASMTFACRLAEVETIPQQDKCGTGFQETHPHVCDADGGTQPLPEWRRAQSRGTAGTVRSLRFRAWLR